MVEGVRGLSVLAQLRVVLWDKRGVCVCSRLVLCVWLLAGWTQIAAGSGVRCVTKGLHGKVARAGISAPTHAKQLGERPRKCTRGCRLKGVKGQWCHQQAGCMLIRGFPSSLKAVRVKSTLQKGTFVHMECPVCLPISHYIPKDVCDPMETS